VIKKDTWNVLVFLNLSRSEILIVHTVVHIASTTALLDEQKKNGRFSKFRVMLFEGLFERAFGRFFDLQGDHTTTPVAIQQNTTDRGEECMVKTIHSLHHRVFCSLTGGVCLPKGEPTSMQVG